MHGPVNVNRIDITYQLTMQWNTVFAADPRGRAV